MPLYRYKGKRSALAIDLARVTIGSCCIATNSGRVHASRLQARRAAQEGVVAWHGKARNVGRKILVRKLWQASKSALSTVYRDAAGQVMRRRLTAKATATAAHRCARPRPCVQHAYTSRSVVRVCQDGQTKTQSTLAAAKQRQK